MKSTDLQHPEDGMSLETRETRDDPAARLKARIERARRLHPSAQEQNQLRQLSTVACFERGRDAAIRAIEDES